MKNFSYLIVSALILILFISITDAKAEHKLVIQGDDFETHEDMTVEEYKQSLAIRFDQEVELIANLPDSAFALPADQSRNDLIAMVLDAKGMWNEFRFNGLINGLTSINEKIDGIGGDDLIIDPSARDKAKSLLDKITLSIDHSSRPSSEPPTERVITNYTSTEQPHEMKGMESMHQETQTYSNILIYLSMASVVLSVFAISRVKKIKSYVGQPLSKDLTKQEKK